VGLSGDKSVFASADGAWSFSPTALSYLPAGQVVTLLAKQKVSNVFTLWRDEPVYRVAVNGTPVGWVALSDAEVSTCLGAAAA
jgi:hypothetical protein